MMTPRLLAPYILRHLTFAQRRGRPVTLDDVVSRLQVRRADVRSAISALHTQGLVDASTMRLTLQGFAIGAALGSRKLPVLARPARVEVSGELDLGDVAAFNRDTSATPPSTRPVGLKRIAAA